MFRQIALCPIGRCVFLWKAHLLPCCVFTPIPMHIRICARTGGKLSCAAAFMHTPVHIRRRKYALVAALLRGWPPTFTHSHVQVESFLWGCRDAETGEEKYTTIIHRVGGFCLPASPMCVCHLICGSIRPLALAFPCQNHPCVCHPICVGVYGYLALAFACQHTHYSLTELYVCMCVHCVSVL